LAAMAASLCAMLLYRHGLRTKVVIYSSVFVEIRSENILTVST